jgi:hypothetical protein
MKRESGNPVLIKIWREIPELYPQLYVVTCFGLPYGHCHARGMMRRPPKLDEPGDLPVKEQSTRLSGNKGRLKGAAEVHSGAVLHNPFHTHNFLFPA